MRKTSETNFPPIFEDAETGVDINVTEKSYGLYSKSSLPKGSITFQQVLEEIQREKEAERALIDKTLKAFATAKKKPEVNANEKGMRNSRWKTASLRMLTRSKSQRDALSK